MSNPIQFLRRIAFIEGVSFLLLLFIAMPLKYFAHSPLPVKITGWLHGVLFVVFCVALLRAMLAARWPLTRAAVVFVAALLPFGPFVIDRRMAGWEAEFVDEKTKQQRLHEGSCGKVLAQLGGQFEGPSDLSANPKYLKDYGK